MKFKYKIFVIFGFMFLIAQEDISYAMGPTELLTRASASMGRCLRKVVSPGSAGWAAADFDLPMTARRALSTTPQLFYPMGGTITGDWGKVVPSASTLITGKPEDLKALAATLSRKDEKECENNSSRQEERGSSLLKRKPENQKSESHNDNFPSGC